MKNSDRKNKLSLAILYSAIIFVTLAVALVLVATTAYLLVEFGVIFNFGEMTRDIGALVWIIAGASLILGWTISFFTSKLTLRPVNHCINEINKLAVGNLDAKIHFSFPYTSMPAFVEVEESFNKMVKELRNVELLRSDFINNFSHEFKTPIVSIAGFAKLLRHADLTQTEREEYLIAIEEESIRLSQMATNVLNLTRIENQEILTGKCEFNLSEQIRSTVLLLEEKWSKKEISFDMDFPEYMIVASEELLKEVWINLIDNAIKFSLHGGEIGIGIEERDGELTVAISNTGSEISEEDKSRIFRKFYQADTSHATEGNGIGLAIVKKVVSLHGGEVYVVSENMKTTFFVTLHSK